MTCAAYRCPSSGRFWMSRTAESPFSSVMWSSHCERSPFGDARHPARGRRRRRRRRSAASTRDVLVELGRIDVDVDLLRVRRVGLQVAGDAIVEAHAERDQQIGLLDRGVDPGLAVHAHHAEVQRMRRREAADAEQRHRDRNLRLLGERLQRRFGAAEDDAVAGEDQRPLGGVDQRERIDAARMARAAPATPRSGAAASQSNSQRRRAARPW